MSTKLVGIVLRADNKHVTAQFYEKLGLTKEDEHQHGTGPKHYGLNPVSPEYVVEIYASSPAFITDAIMLEVDSITEALLVAAQFSIAPELPVKDAGPFTFVYITDPDGRDVMLIEKKK
jgi:hypothetical protein